MEEINICRICLNRSASISLFDKHEDVQHSAKIMRCVNIEIFEDDGLPSFVCVNCLSELFIAYEFVQKCESSDRTLRMHPSDLDMIQLHPPKVEVPIKDELKFEPDDQDSHYDDFLLNIDSLPLEPIETKKHETVKGKVKVKKRRGEKIGPLQCMYCGLMVVSPSAMTIHLRIHTGETPYSCPTCDRRFQNKGSLKRHTETFHSNRERKFTCETCGNSFFRKTDIINHMRVHTDERPYTCPYCSKQFRQIASLIRHKRTHTGEKPYSCSVCDKKFTDRSHMNKHQLVHTDERKFVCHLCSKSVKSKTALAAHLAIHTNQKSNICNFCGTAFSMKGNLKIHIKRVHSERSGQCDICLKTFSDLEEHMNKHTGLKPYICALCSARFASKRSLTNHTVFKHENADKFKCSIGDCTRTFPTATMLEFHLLKQHTNHTPYVCQHCARGFFRNSDLSRHLRVSHMEVKVPLKMSVSVEQL